jgi:hypothetical protein
MSILADISQGNSGFADVMFLVAMILFLIAGFIAYTAKALWATVMCIGLAAVSLGWLVL